MENRICSIGVTACFTLAAIAILTCLVIRIWFVSSDPFDPMREISIDVLWVAVMLFLSGAAIASVIDA